MSDWVPEEFAACARRPVVVVTGPTATGKTRLAVALAREFGGEILSVDSRQVYRGMDIGTGKDLSEYSEGGAPVPCHLVDVAEPGEAYDLYRFLKDARECFCQVVSRGSLPVLCGGTPLYLAALLDGYEMAGGPPDPAIRKSLEGKDTRELMEILRREASPELLARTDVTQDRRIIRAIEIARSGTAEIPPALTNHIILAPKYTRTEVRERVRLRLDARLEEGMVEEVRALHEEGGVSWEKLEWFGLEYRYVGRFLTGQLSWQEMHDTLLTQIRQFVKRQDVWFRKLEREGHEIHWISQGDIPQAVEVVREFLAKQEG